MSSEVLSTSDALRLKLLRSLCQAGACLGDSPSIDLGTLAEAELRGVEVLKAAACALSNELEVLSHNAAAARQDAEALALTPSLLSDLLSEIDAAESEKRAALEAQFVSTDSALELHMRDGGALRDELLALSSQQVLEQQDVLQSRFDDLLRILHSVPCYPQTQSILKVLRRGESGAIPPFWLLRNTLEPGDVKLSGVFAYSSRRRVLAGSIAQLTLTVTPEALAREGFDRRDAMDLLCGRSNVDVLYAAAGQTSMLRFTVSTASSALSLRPSVTLGLDGVTLSILIPSDAPIGATLLLRNLGVSGIHVALPDDLLTLVVDEKIGISPGTRFSGCGFASRNSFGPVPSIASDGTVYAIRANVQVVQMSPEGHILRTVPPDALDKISRPNTVIVDETSSLLLIAGDNADNAADGMSSLVAIDLSSMKPRWTSKARHGLSGAFGVAVMAPQARHGVGCG
jgi:hypothetical protein